MQVNARKEMGAFILNTHFIGKTFIGTVGTYECFVCLCNANHAFFSSFFWGAKCIHTEHDMAWLSTDGKFTFMHDILLVRVGLPVLEYPTPKFGCNIYFTATDRRKTEVAVRERLSVFNMN